MRCVLILCLVMVTGAQGQAIDLAQQTPPTESPADASSPHAVWLTGHSPPLVASWNRRDPGGWGPTYQLQALREGVPIMPTLAVPWPWNVKSIDKSTRALLTYAQQNGLPICLLSSQPEGVMMKRKEFRDLPRDESPNEWRLGKQGELDSTPRLSPVGAVSAWAKAGKWWVDNRWFADVQRIYPHPPWVYWLSNNEAALLRQNIRAEDLGFIDQYGSKTSEAEAQEIFGKHWIEKYQTMFGAIRDGLPQYGSQIQFVGYGMANYRLGNYDPVYGYGWQAQIWDGNSPPFYMNHWQRERDFQLDSIQSIHAAWVPLTEWQNQQRGHWFREVSVWHGASKQLVGLFLRVKGGYFSTERWAGLVKFAVFMHRPRVLRQFSNSTRQLSDPMLSDEEFQKLIDAGLPPDTPRTTHGDYWNEVVSAVQYFWDDETARRFLVDGDLVTDGTPWPRRYWKKTAGDLRVPNYLLKCSANPKTDAIFGGDVGNYGRVDWPVFAIARQIGDQYLIYAHAPRGPVTTKITIGGDEIGPITVPPEGVFVTHRRGHVVAPAN